MATQWLFQYQVVANPLFTTPEVITSDKWYQPLSEPVRTRVITSALIAAAFTIGTPPSVAPISWLQPFSEPVRSKPQLPTPEQRFFEPSPQPITPSFGWFEELSKPTPRKAGLAAHQQQALGWAPINIVVQLGHIGWFANLSEPVRLKPRLPEAEQRFFEFNPQPITPSLGWLVELSKPTPRRSLATWLQQASAWTPITIIVPDLGHIGWYANLSEPVRTRPALRAAMQPFAVGSLNPLVSFSWWQPTAELPPRRKPGLAAHQQQAFTKSTFTPLPVIGWNQARTELPPARLRGLDAWRQQSTAWTPINIAPFVGITGVWASTETKDRFLASGTMFEAPFEAVAGVIEKRLTNGLSGVVEDPLPGAIVSTNVSIRTI